MRANRKFNNKKGVAKITFEAFNTSSFVTNNNVGFIDLRTSTFMEVSFEVIAYDINNNIIYNYFDTKSHHSIIQVHKGWQTILNYFQGTHSFGEVAHKAIACLYIHTPEKITSMRISTQINNVWNVKDISQIEKLKNVTSVIIEKPFNQTPNFNSLQKLGYINATIPESHIDDRYIKLKNLGTLKLYVPWSNGVSTNIASINKLTNLGSLFYHPTSKNYTYESCLPFNEESQNLQLKGYNYFSGTLNEYRENLKNLVNLTHITTSCYGVFSRPLLDLTYPLLNGQSNENLTHINYFGQFNHSKYADIVFPNIEDLPNLENLSLNYLANNSTYYDTQFDSLYTWFFTKVYNPEAGHIHHNNSLPIGFTHQKMRTISLAATLGAADRDKAQEIRRTGVSAYFRKEKNLTTFTPNASNWTNTLNTDVAIDGEITKNNGGDAHNNGGGFIEMLGLWNDAIIEAKPSNNSSYSHIGFTDNTQNSIAISQLKYGIYFRSDSNTSQQVQFIKDGNVQNSIDIPIKTDKVWWVKRIDGKITAGYDTTTVHTFQNPDTSDIFDLNPLKVMTSIYTEGEGIKEIKLKN